MSNSISSVADRKPDKPFEGFPLFAHPSGRAKLAERLGKVRLRNKTNRCCSIFNHAHESNLIDKPICYGRCFPSALALRRGETRPTCRQGQWSCWQGGDE